MSAMIHQFIVHQLHVNAEKKLTLIPRDNCISVTPSIETLVAQINHAFNGKPSKGIGKFSEAEEEQNFEFKKALDNVLQGDESQPPEHVFQSFSQQSAAHLIATMADMQMVETGFLVFCRYEYLATDYLMVCLLNTQQHVHVDEQLELTISEHLDLAKMQLAARIDLTQYAVQPEKARYISFIKGRMGRKVADFFMAFLGCEELMDVKQQNAQLINSVDAYLAQEQLNGEEKHQHREAVKDYYKEKIASGDDIQLSELSARLPADTEQNFDFTQFVQDSETVIEETFQPDKTVIKQLAKFSGQGGGITLNFDRHLYGDKVKYDAHTDTLVIRGIPPNLKDQLMRHEK
ncbi:nucleoid-associated protein YejK [Alteromonas flava]|uniref:nucleoid-associated protein YejK n=1 Tax=Alteromonas flava TaxID=2048003 RepID=UPI000C288EA5|nr:nucleoid-associated protein YejK [Alteromonas flava]